jgi:hypothetical protein
LHYEASKTGITTYSRLKAYKESGIVPSSFDVAVGCVNHCMHLGDSQIKTPTPVHPLLKVRKPWKVWWIFSLQEQKKIKNGKKNLMEKSEKYFFVNCLSRLQTKK